MSTIKIVDKHSEPKVLVRRLKDIKFGSVIAFVDGVSNGDLLSIEQAKKAISNKVKGIVVTRCSGSNQIEVFRFTNSFSDCSGYFSENYLVIEFEYHFHLNFIFQEVVETG